MKKRQKIILRYSIYEFIKLIALFVFLMEIKIFEKIIINNNDESQT